MSNNSQVLNILSNLYWELFNHDGFGELRVEIRLLKRGQKEVIIHCGKQYRFVVDYAGAVDRPARGHADAAATACGDTEPV